MYMCACVCVCVCVWGGGGGVDGIVCINGLLKKWIVLVVFKTACKYANKFNLNNKQRKPPNDP